MKQSSVSRASQIGKFGEQLARRALETYGYAIIESNWKSASGEIDIIARDSATLVFVEVKTRRSKRFGMPEEALTTSKTRHIVNTALEYMLKSDQQDASWRVDVIAIELAQNDKVVRLAHYKGVDA